LEHCALLRLGKRPHVSKNAARASVVSQKKSKIQYTLPLSYEVPFYPQKAMFVPKMVLILISIAIRFLKQYRSAKE